MAEQQFTETTEHGWLNRLAESIKSVIAGLLLFVAAFPLLFFGTRVGR